VAACHQTFNYFKGGHSRWDTKQTGDEDRGSKGRWTKEGAGELSVRGRGEWGFKEMVGQQGGEQLDLIIPVRLLLSWVLARGTTNGRSLNLRDAFKKHTSYLE
jgi:hypothetical protein